LSPDQCLDTTDVNDAEITPTIQSIKALGEDAYTYFGKKGKPIKVWDFWQKAEQNETLVYFGI